MKRTSLLLEVGQDRRQVASACSSTGPEVERRFDAQLAGDDVRERRLAEAGRAEQQHVVQRLAAPLGGADEDLELLARLRLADVFGQPLRPQRALDRLFVRRDGNAADDPSVQACSARHGRAGGELVGLDAHGALSNHRSRTSARTSASSRRQSRRAASLPPRLAPGRSGPSPPRCVAEERRADARRGCRRAAGQARWPRSARSTASGWRRPATQAAHGGARHGSRGRHGHARRQSCDPITSRPRRRRRTACGSRAS